MSPICFLDTNVLLYSISGDPAEAPKKEQALALTDRNDVGVSVQVLSEFYVQATRATRRDRIPHKVAAGLVQCWARFPVQDNNVAVMNHALEIRVATGFSCWDSAIIAAACALGCRELISEDMASGRIVEGVRIVNPFR